MSQRSLLFAILTVGIISTAYLATLVVSTSPYDAGSPVLWAFFSSLCVSLASIVSLLWYAVARLILHQRTAPKLVPILRKSTLISLIVVVSLLLNTLGIFKLFDVIPLVAAAVLIEFFFQAEKRPQATIDYDAME